jgi:hypothetical protein
MVAKPAASRGVWLGALLVLAAAALVAAAGWGLAVTWPGPAAAVLFSVLLVGLVLLSVAAYWLFGLLTLTYSVSRDGVTLSWAASRTTVPMGDITHILQGRPYAEPLRGLRWPGHEVGRTTLVTDDGLRRELFVLATLPPERQLILVTSDVAYALSPQSRSAFVRELMLRRHIGPVQPLEHGTRNPLLGRFGIVRDSLAARLLLLAALVNAVAFAWLIWHYPALPSRVALWYQYDATAGRPITVSLQPLALAWQLPAVGFLALALNAAVAAAVYARARLGAHFLALGAVVLQLLILVTLLRMPP